jgi:hypothetical protein
MNGASIWSRMNRSVFTSRALRSFDKITALPGFARWLPRGTSWTIVSPSLMIPTSGMRTPFPACRWH